MTSSPILPPNFPEPWASAYGQDRYGVWQEFSLAGVVQRFRWLPPGEFLMGSPPDEPEREAWGIDETQHPVKMSHGFWLAGTACTQALWQAVLREMPSFFSGADRPVETVSWDDISERFLPALNERIPGLAAVLPSEAQWEYACRAGTATPFWFGDTISPQQVNYDGSYPYGDGKKGLVREETVAVTALPANGWGLYQMHGNVWEWCQDWLGAYPQGLSVDPTGPLEGRLRALRGGSWILDAGSCRSARRFGYEPGDRDGIVGFRLARGFPGPEG